jgi:ABC-type sugar transport system ATPase subunit
MLEVKDINVQFGNFSLKSVEFSVSKGDYFILLGVSGAGKSMILETIAGLVKPDSGSILLDGKDITRAKIQNRSVGLVFQDHAIFPHMTVRENIGYSLYGISLAHDERKKRIEEIAGQMNIISLLGRRPSTLSGGELQRVALARTLIQHPAVLLLDEPLASMDIQLRSELRSLLRQLNRTGQTIIHVTHDYEEAISLGNKIAVINNGIILQQGSPEEVFHHPASEFVAHFTGARNFFPAVPVKDAECSEAWVSGSVKVKLTSQTVKNEGFVLIRNEDIFLSGKEVDTSAVNNFRGVIRDIVPSRTGVEILIDIGIPIFATITRESLTHLDLKENSHVWVHFKATAIRYIEKS